MDDERTRRFLRNLTQLAAHCTENGWGLDEDDIFSEQVIAHYIQCRVQRTGTPQPQDLSVLRQARRLLLDNPKGDLDIMPAKVRTPALAFTELELPAIEQWAVSQRDANNQRNACAIVSLGIGCGLKSGEMLLVTKDDVELTPLGLVVHVKGKSPRSVPVLTRWQSLLADAMDSALVGKKLLGIEAEAAFTKYVGGYLDSHGGPALARLRATWLMSHLRWGTPIDLIKAASGNRQLDWILPYLPYVERDAESADRLLRGSGAI